MYITTYYMELSANGDCQNKLSFCQGQPLHWVWHAAGTTTM